MLSKEYIKELLSSEQLSVTIGGGSLLRLDLFLEIKNAVSQLAIIQQSIVCYNRRAILMALSRLVDNYYRIMGYFRLPLVVNFSPAELVEDSTVTKFLMSLNVHTDSLNKLANKVIQLSGIQPTDVTEIQVSLITTLLGASPLCNFSDDDLKISFEKVVEERQYTATPSLGNHEELYLRTTEYFKPDYIKYDIDIKDMLNKYGKDLYVIAMEECSELQVALGTHNSTNIIEECVDLLFIFNWLQLTVKQDLISRSNFYIDSIKSESSCLILASCIKVFSKIYRGVLDVNSSVVEDTINSLAVLVFRLLATFGTQETVIADWLTTKVAKIEQNYRDGSQH